METVRRETPHSLRREKEIPGGRENVFAKVNAIDFKRCNRWGDSSPPSYSR